MCKTLNIKVLPYFHCYRGSAGKVAQFSASVSKVYRIRKAIEEHGGSFRLIDRGADGMGGATARLTLPVGGPPQSEDKNAATGLQEAPQDPSIRKPQPNKAVASTPEPVGTNGATVPDQERW